MVEPRPWFAGSGAAGHAVDGIRAQRLAPHERRLLPDLRGLRVREP